MIDYILELAADLDRAIQHEHMSVVYQVAKPLADELDRFDAADFVPEVRADLVRVRTDVRRMCTKIFDIDYKAMWSYHYPRIERLVKGHVGNRGQNALLPQRPPPIAAGTKTGNKEVFISYAHEDEVVVKALVNFLQAAGYTTWFDKDDLLGGQEWETVIPKAIAASRLVMLVFSSHSVSKRGFVQKELRLALEEASKIPPSEVYIMPVRLDLCERPDPIGRYHMIDLFGEKDISKLLESIKSALNKDYCCVNSSITRTLLCFMSAIQEKSRSSMTTPLAGLVLPVVENAKLSAMAQALRQEILTDERSKAKGLTVATASPTQGFYVSYLWDHTVHKPFEAHDIRDISAVKVAIGDLLEAGILRLYHESQNTKWYVLTDSSK